VEVPHERSIARTAIQRGAIEGTRMSDIISISVFYEFTALLVRAAPVGLIGLALRQPLIVSFIASASWRAPRRCTSPAHRNTSSCSPTSAWPCRCSWSG
jgi:hypothetical protein